jgi:hypothetical protein
MLAADWTLGALHAAHVLPLWPFITLNFPFGLPFVWLESQWDGAHYRVGGQIVSETWSFFALVFAAFAQAWLYSVLLGHWRRKRHETLA